jgi:hypothetical protein
LCGGVDEEEERAPSSYRTEGGDGRGTRGIAITALAEVGSGRSAGGITINVAQTAEVTQIAGAPEKTHQARIVARRAQRNVRQTQADTLRVRRDASETHI